MSSFCEVENIVSNTFPQELKNNTLDILSFFKSESMDIQQLFGYWHNQLYYSVNYQNECVCYILFNGTGDEKQFAPLTIWTDDSGSKWYEHSELGNDGKIIAWKHIDYCVHCGSCKGGTRKVIFNKAFDDVCKTATRFTNPGKEEFSLIKKIILFRKSDIERFN